MIKTAIHSIKKGFDYNKMAVLIYGIQLAISLVLGFQIYQVMKITFGASEGLYTLLHGFDYSIFNDFLNVHGDSITPILGQLKYIIIAYMLASVFINAGVLYALFHQQKTLTNFWIGASQYFFSFLKISLAIILLAGIWTAIVWIPLLSNFEAAMEYFYTERPYVWMLIGAIPIYLTGLSFLFNWSVNWRLYQLESTQMTNGHWKFSLNKTRRDFWKNYVIFLIFVLILFLVSAVYLVLTNYIGMVSFISIIVLIIAQQALALFRVFFRFGLYQYLLNRFQEGT